MSTWPHARGLRAPALPPSGIARVPSSKSEAIRTVLVAARADWLRDGSGPAGAPSPAISIGPLRADEIGGDVAAALGVAEALGARVARGEGPTGGRVLVTPRAAEHRPAGRVELFVGESATLARFATAIAALDPHYPETRIAGSGTLARRRSPALFRALRLAGAELVFEAAEHGWPVRVKSRTGPSPHVLCVDAPESSQEVSALLLAGGGPDAAHPEVSIGGEVPSRPYLALTIAVLGAFGLAVEETPDYLGEQQGRGRGRRRLAVRPATGPARRTLALEPDASLAGVVLAAACLAGGDLRVPGLGHGTVQGDARVAAHLAALGCGAELGEGGLRAGGRATRGAELELAGEPDLAPVLAAVAADAALSRGARSRLKGLGTLAGKESDRLAGIAEALAAVGVAVAIEGREALAILPGGTRASSLVLDARGDHRMAYLHALLGLVVPGVMTRDGRCVDKTWPGFWEDMEALGFEVVRGA